VIRFGPGGPELQSVHPGVDAASVAGVTGFALAAGDPPETEPPTEAELEALAAVDPHRLRELEFKQLRAAATERRAHA